MGYFSVRQNGDTAEIVNPTGQVFCSVFMGEGVYDLITEKRALVVAESLNASKDSGLFDGDRSAMQTVPEDCGRSNEDLECLGCGHKLGEIGHRRLHGEPDYCPGVR